MKNNQLLILCGIFLLGIYTFFLWADGVGFVWLALISIALFLSFLCLGICLVGNIALGIKEKFKDKQRNIITVALSLVLAVAYFQPFGLLTADRFEGKDLFIAQREGSANCMTVLKLKENNTFFDQTVCFGIDRLKGNYRIERDTIYFYNVELARDDKRYYEFAVIQKSDGNSDSYLGELVRYKNRNDTTATALWIVKNDLK